ncbi:hypothetical protein [Hydrogenophaga soli]
MNPQPTRPLTQAGRTHAPALLQGLDDPHAELLSLVWGPRFDREHALGLWARLSQQQPTRAAPLLPVLLSAADHFDALGGPGQHRVRRLILRHRARCLEGGLSESTP